jgi:hypothetical protein
MLIAFPRVGAQDRARGRMGMAAFLSSRCQTARKRRIASSEWRIEAVRALAILVLTFVSLYLLLTIRFSFPYSLLTIRYSLLSFAHPR